MHVLIVIQVFEVDNFADFDNNWLFFYSIEIYRAYVMEQFYWLISQVSWNSSKSGGPLIEESEEIQIKGWIDFLTAEL